VPKLTLYFDKHFPDDRWANTTFALDMPGGKAGEFVLGRSPVADLTFDIKSVSIRHAAIAYSYARDSWSLSDLGSRNGTIIRGAKIEPDKPEPLNIGDKFWLGPDAKIHCVEDEQDTISPDEAGPPTIASTSPLSTLPPELPSAPPPPPVARTYADSAYLMAQWVVSGQTRAGKVYRLIVAAAGVAFFILMVDWLTQ
jgi:predicted component of type VI protein secretion system